jgi:hypothetical protein
MLFAMLIGRKLVKKAKREPPDRATMLPAANARRNLRSVPQPMASKMVETRSVTG